MISMSFKSRWMDTRERKASALLLSFFLMSMLILVAISVSVIVIRDMATVRTIVSGVQSFYAAEGSAELGLHTLKISLPGYEPSFDALVLANASQTSLETHARESTVPCEGQGDIWRALSQNESVQIPLFAQIDSAGTLEDIDDFYVEFYVGDEDGDVTFPPSTDVLRWKILGLTDTTGSGDTEAISEYIPLYTYNGAGASESNPTFFGTDEEALGVMPDGYLNGKFYQAGGNFNIYPISSFVTSHETNYLVLTNVVTRSAENTIFFRFHATGVEGVCEYAELASTGWTDFGDTQQELTTYMKEGENLPVFDFVIYHTDPDLSIELSPYVTLPDGVDFSFPSP